MTQQAPSSDPHATGPVDPRRWDGLPASERAILLVLALEGHLSEKQLLSFDPPPGSLARWEAAGFVERSGATGRFSERGLDTLSVERSVRHPWLRGAARAGELEGAATLAASILGTSKSSSGTMLRILTGRLTPRQTNSASDSALSGELRRSLTEPFDPTWLTWAWKERATNIALHVLKESLPSLAPCQRLCDWCGLQEFPPERRAEAGDVLSTHALLREDAERAVERAEDCSPQVRLAVAAIAALQASQLGAARLLAKRALSFQFEQNSGPPSFFTPALLFLLLTSSDEEDRGVAERGLRAKRGRAELSAELKILRKMARQQAEPAHEGVRCSMLQAETASAWEWLLSGLYTHAAVTHIWTRQAWADALIDQGLAWQGRGYPWMARQALLLAQELAPHEAAKRLDGQADDAFRTLSKTSADLVSLPLAVPAWRRTLHQLLAFDEHPTLPTHRERVVWFVDVQGGSLARPVLEQFAPKRGFVEKARLSLEELCQQAHDLPPEDRRVIDVIQRSTCPEVEGLEALVGHPRVRAGIRSPAVVEIGQGRYFIETIDEPDSLFVRISPEGIAPGLNVLRRGPLRLDVIRVPEDVGPVLAYLSGGLRIPREHQAEALRALETLAARFPMESPPIRDAAPEAADTTPCLRVTKCFGAFLVELGVRPFGPDGRFFQAGVGPAQLSGRRDGRPSRVERTLEQEQQRVTALTLSLPELTESSQADPERPAWLLSEAGVLELLSSLQRSAQPCAVEWNETSPYRLRGGSNSVSGLQVAVRPKKGWYLLAGKIALDEVTQLTLAELVRLPALARGRFVRLPSGEYFELHQTVRQLLAGVRGVADEAEPGATVRVSAAQVIALGALNPPPWLTLNKEVSTRFARLGQGNRAPVPLGLQATLRPYQVAGFQWLVRLASLSLGACLADDMGLGKTLQLLALLLTRPRGTRHLIIAPTSVCTNWLREAERFAPDLATFEWSRAQTRTISEELAARGTERSLVVVISYGQLVRAQQDFCNIAWDTLVLDEAQFIKNAQSERARACYALEAQVKIAATGTPIENHLGDLWSLFRFLCPGLLGSHRHFVTVFQKPIEREGDLSARELLQQMTRPFLLRRTKAEVLRELPPISHVRHEVELNRQEALRYAVLRREIQGRLKDRKSNNKVEILAEITKLRRFCCHPRLVFPEAPLESSKLEHLLDLTSELVDNGHRALIFSQYVDYLEIVREQMSEAGLRLQVLDGSVEKAERQRRIDAFQAGEFDFFLISLKAGGFGINLTRADYVIHLDPWWNPAAMSQATDRAHRFGQKSPVVVYEFVTRATLEEDVYALHQRKQTLSQTTLSHGADPASLSPEEWTRWLQAALSKGEDV